MPLWFLLLISLLSERREVGLKETNEDNEKIDPNNLPNPYFSVCF